MRRRVQNHVATKVMFATDLRCCLCDPISGLPPRPRNGQIHHLDEDPTNNRIDNLVWLCLDHHEEAGKRGKAARRLTPDIIRHYRELLRKRVLRDRKLASESERMRKQSIYTDVLDAQVVMHLSGLRARAGKDWENVKNVLHEVAFFPSVIGFRGRTAVLDFLYTMASRTRFRMPTFIGETIAQLTIDLLPLRFLDSAKRCHPSKQDCELLETGIEIGSSLAYDGALYVRDLKIVDSGCEVLWRILSCSRIHSLSQVESHVLDGFRTALDAATRSKNQSAIEIVGLTRKHGTEGQWRAPDYPRQLAETIYAD